MESKPSTFAELLAGLDAGSVKTNVYELPQATDQDESFTAVYALEAREDLQESKTYLVSRTKAGYRQVFPSLWPTDVSSCDWPDFIGRVGPFAALDAFRGADKCQILRKVKPNGAPVLIRFMPDIKAWIMRVAGRVLAFKDRNEL